MLLTTIVLGTLGLYYFGRRVAAYAAGATLALCIVALAVPRLATPIHAFIAAGAFALWRIGSRRPRPPEAVLAVRMVQSGLRRAWQLLNSRKDR